MDLESPSNGGTRESQIIEDVALEQWLTASDNQKRKTERKISPSKRKLSDHDENLLATFKPKVQKVKELIKLNVNDTRSKENYPPISTLNLVKSIKKTSNPYISQISLESSSSEEVDDAKTEDIDIDEEEVAINDINKKELAITLEHQNEDNEYKAEFDDVQDLDLLDDMELDSRIEIRDDLIEKKPAQASIKEKITLPDMSKSQQAQEKAKTVVTEKIEIQVIDTDKKVLSEELTHEELSAVTEEPEELEQNVDLEGEEEEEEDGDEEEEDEQIPDNIREEIETFCQSFPTLDSKYTLLNKIGEGTFSTVYKAKPLFNLKSSTGKYVALKRIYVTSSPNRIFNELSLLNSLIGNKNVAPLLDAIRFEDQVIAVLPYYKHADFREFYRDLPLAGIKFYMYELLQAIKFVHSKNIIHRDIKPTNFLYDPFTRHGVLVDFGLAEKETVSELSVSSCVCLQSKASQQQILTSAIAGTSSSTAQAASGFPNNAYLKEDQRPARRANRAGTRGFRAPEVLFKCNNQTTKIDIWSAGVMLLTLLGRRFPFFQSTDDVEALMEITNIFGVERMKECAKQHGLGFECVGTKIENGHSFGELLLFCVSTDAKEGDTFGPDSPAWEILHVLDKKGERLNNSLGREYKDAIELLGGLMKLDFNERISAREALKMDFFKELKNKGCYKAST